MTKKKEEMAKTISKNIYYKECLSSRKITKMSVNRESKTHYWMEYEGHQPKLIPKTSVLNYEDAKIEYLEQQIEQLSDTLDKFKYDTNANIRELMWNAHTHTLLGQKI